MILDTGERVVAGAVADLRSDGVEGEAVVAAVRGEASPVAVHCQPPGAVFERVGWVRPGMTVERRCALAAAARSRGRTAPQDETIAELEERLAEMETPEAAPSPPAVDADERERVRERVAELRGRVQTLEEQGEDPTEARDELARAAARLAELDTRRVATRETRERARVIRDRREQRLRLEDRLANRRREARAALAEAVWPDYADAVRTLDPGADPEFADASTAALAVLHVARPRAPVVLGVDAVDAPAAPARWLGTSLVWV